MQQTPTAARHAGRGSLFADRAPHRQRRSGVYLIGAGLLGLNGIYHFFK